MEHYFNFFLMDDLKKKSSSLVKHLGCFKVLSGGFFMEAFLQGASGWVRGHEPGACSASAILCPLLLVW